MDENRYYLDEMAKLERQKKGLTDKHNTLQTNENMDRIEKLIQTNSILAPKTGETWHDYAKQLALHVKYANDKNYKIHIENNGKKSWYTHRMPSGCFMCQDRDLQLVMLTIIEAMAKAHPTNIF